MNTAKNEVTRMKKGKLQAKVTLDNNVRGSTLVGYLDGLKLD